ncbi:MAG: type II toxin-antitoxin system RelE/ParE family toxin, partial [Paracoccus sp. (in: a-proteobacteria)]|nr:type II toxin-antitoxin system RelE/ParE family toxin [Paracoccus sp. (in: a-proteobacteria)]
MRVLWSDHARKDSLEILRYVAQNNSLTADRTIDAIETAANGLGAMATGRPGRVFGTYEKPVPRYP